MRTVLENVGYQRQTAVDWNKLTDKLGAAVSQIGINRDKAIAENEAIESETNSLLNKPLNLEKQSLNTFVIGSSDAAREKLLQAKRDLYSKKISSADYKKIASNLQEHWQNFADQAKTADDRFKLYQDRMTPNAEGVIEASDAENFLMEQYLNAADLNNKKMVIGKDGSMYLQQVDENGNQVGELIDYRDFARPENMQINRVDVSSLVDNSIGNWKAIDKYRMLGRGGEETITSIKNQPDYKLMKVNVAEAATANPKSALSILVDNGVIDAPQYYTTDLEREQLLNENINNAKASYEAAGKQFTDADKKAIEMSLVKFSKNAAGEFIPVLTNDQLAEAKKRVEQEIDMQIETKIQATPPSYSSGGGGNGSDNSESKYATYASVYDAWTSGNMDILNNMNPEYYFQWDPKKKQVHVKKIEYVTDNKGDTKKEYRYISSASKARDLSRYFWKESTKAQAEEKFDAEQAAARKAGLGGDSESNSGSNSGGNAR